MRKDWQNRKEGLQQLEMQGDVGREKSEVGNSGSRVERRKRRKRR